MSSTVCNHRACYSVFEFIIMFGFGADLEETIHKTKACSILNMMKKMGEPQNSISAVFKRAYLLLQIFMKLGKQISGNLQ